LRVRANPNVQFKLLDTMSPSERAQMGTAAEDPELYAMLIRTGRPERVQLVSAEVALMFLSLREPGRIPQRFLDDEPAVIRLILDHILEVEKDEHWISGSGWWTFSAADGEEHPDTAATERETVRLSLAALLYGQALQLADATVLAGRLYAYNRVPCSPDWYDSLTHQTVEEYSGLSESLQKGYLGQGWYPDQDSASPWALYRSHRPGTSHHVGGTFKLYISPAVGALSEAVPAVISLLDRTRASAFKLARTSEGLLRPDKLVVYFSEFEDLHEFASRVSDRIRGLPTQPVPFTSGIDREGMVSWAMDPPSETYPVAGRERISWRIWVTDRLARALVDAQQESVPQMPPSRAAVLRIAAEGVDVKSWCPSSALMQAAVWP
jgi:hypothetical protein